MGNHIEAKFVGLHLSGVTGKIDDHDKRPIVDANGIVLGLIDDMWLEPYHQPVHIEEGKLVPSVGATCDWWQAMIDVRQFPAFDV